MASLVPDKSNTAFPPEQMGLLLPVILTVGNVLTVNTTTLLYVVPQPLVA